MRGGGGYGGPELTLDKMEMCTRNKNKKALTCKIH